MLCILREKGKFLLQLILKLNISTPKTLRNILPYVSHFCIDYHNNKTKNELLPCTRRKLRERENCCPRISHYE